MPKSHAPRAAVAQIAAGAALALLAIYLGTVRKRK